MVGAFKNVSLTATFMMLYIITSKSEAMTGGSTFDLLMIEGVCISQRHKSSWKSRFRFGLLYCNPLHIVISTDNPVPASERRIYRSIDTIQPSIAEHYRAELWKPCSLVMNQRPDCPFISSEEARRNFKYALPSERNVRNALFSKVDSIAALSTGGDACSKLQFDWSLPKILDFDNMFPKQKILKSSIPSS